MRGQHRGACDERMAGKLLDRGQCNLRVTTCNVTTWRLTQPLSPSPHHAKHLTRSPINISTKHTQLTICNTTPPTLPSRRHGVRVRCRHSCRSRICAVCTSTAVTPRTGDVGAAQRGAKNSRCRSRRPEISGARNLYPTAGLARRWVGEPDRPGWGGGESRIRRGWGRRIRHGWRCRCREDVPVMPGLGGLAGWRQTWGSQSG